MKTTHNDIEIEYDEKENLWKFELRGRSRSAESLAKAKEYIDKPVTEKEDKTFKRTKIYLAGRYDRDTYKMAEATSVGNIKYRAQHMWVSCDGKRSEERLSDCFEASGHNQIIIARITELRNEIGKLNDELAKQKSNLKPLTI